MNKLYRIEVYVNSRSKFTDSALRLVENIHSTEAIVMGETEKEFADSIANDISDLNNGVIDGVEIVLTCLHDLPHSRFSYSDITAGNVNV